jgi:PhoPQ-activated pathogenicity-related protein
MFRSEDNVKPSHAFPGIIRLLALLFLFSSCGANSGGQNPDPGSVEDPPPAGITDDSSFLAANPVSRSLAEPDLQYGYSLERVTVGVGYATHVLKLRSQRWLDESMVDQPLWWHWLTVVVPDEVKHSVGLLWIEDGDHQDPAPVNAPPFLVEAAVRTGTVTASLRNVPFQPLVFAGDKFGPRWEDHLIAHGWRVFMEEGAGDEKVNWLVQVPMTRAAIRAMDAVIDFSGHRQVVVDRFLVSGASKRGWATWTAGIFDNRVLAVAPMVIDVLNIRPSLEHHWQAYGEWSPAISEYEEEGIMDWQMSAEFARSLELIDPYAYRERLTMPKFVINAASDEFFLPDSWQFYWDDLPGEKHLRYVPNAGHSLIGTDAMQSLIAFHEYTVTGATLPRFAWRVNNGQAIIETDPDQPPSELRLWQVTNPAGRDFRLYRLRDLGRAWSSEILPLAGNGRYTATVGAPKEGFTAWFVEATFPGLSGIPLKLSTGVVVVPDLYPFEPYVPDRPLGTLIPE